MCALFTTVSALLFIVASFWGGFRIDFPSWTLSVSNPVRPLVIAVVLGGIYEMLDRRQRRAGAVTVLSRASVSGVDEQRYRPQGGVILFVSVLIGVRFAFKTYEPYLMGKGDGFALMALVPFMVAGAALGAWRADLRARRGGAGKVAWFPVLLWALFPLAFPLHPATTLACLVAAFVLPASPGVWNPGPRRMACIGGGCVLLAVLVIVSLHNLGFGWAGKHVLVAMADRVPFPAVWLLLCVFGLLSILRLQSGFRLSAHRAGWLALPGLALAGTRGVWGDAGVILLLPLVSVLLMAALAEIDRRLEAASMHFARNIMLLCLAGMLSGFLGLNLRRGVQASPTVREQPENGPVTPEGTADIATVPLS